MVFLNDVDQHLQLQLMEPDELIMSTCVPRSLPKLAIKVLGEFLVPPFPPLLASAKG